MCAKTTSGNIPSHPPSTKSSSQSSFRDDPIPQNSFPPCSCGVVMYFVPACPRCSLGSCLRASAAAAARLGAAAEPQPNPRTEKTYKELHPKSEPHQQGRRKPGKPSVRYTGQDAEFTESSDDDGEEGKKSRRVANPLARPKGDAGAAAAAAAASAAAAAASAVVKKELASWEEEDGDNTAAMAEAMAAAVASGGGDGGGRRSKRKGKRGKGDASRQGKRARVVNVAEGGGGGGGWVLVDRPTDRPTVFLSSLLLSCFFVFLSFSGGFARCG